MKRSKLSIGILAFFASLNFASAKVVFLTASMDGAQANSGAGTGSPGTGTAALQYDDASGTLSWNIAWQDLLGTPNAMHFHGPADPDVNAGVQLGIGVGSNPTIGSAVITTGQAADLLAGLWYVNLHTSAEGGGEIRGQVLPALIDYWPLEEIAGMVAPNAVADRTDGALFNGASWITDDTRGQVLEFDGADSYVDAGLLPPISLDSDFTYSFWSNTAQGVNGNVILGNRYMDATNVDFAPREFIKFTTTQFEWHANAVAAGNVDYPDPPIGQWIHNALVKSGQTLVYFRDGLVSGSNSITDAPLNQQPLFFGGNGTFENWAGRMDDVALFGAALTAPSVIALAGGATGPAETDPALPGADLIPILTDTFDGDLTNWIASDRGLENNAPAGYNPPDTGGEQLTLGGATAAQYWYGSSLESNMSFDSRVETRVTVDRISLAGAGTAYRSSLWIFGDSEHYLHYSQDVGETGWSWNANDVAGVGTRLPTGSGNNIASLDALDNDGGSHQMSIHMVPLGSGRVNMFMFLDGQMVSANGFSNFPPSFKVILTGQARATGDSVTAVFDNLVVEQELVENLPPFFSSSNLTFPDATEATPYSQSVAGEASDPEMDDLTFSKTGGPAWLNVDAAGLITGTPTIDDRGINLVNVEVDDGNGNTATTTVSIRVRVLNPTLPPLWGAWPLDEGTGNTANDVSGNGRNATIFNELTGGQGIGGAAWVEDPECGMVLSFNGLDNTGTYARVGDPPATGLLPLFTLEDGFTWSFWAKSTDGPSNDIILGNRWSEAAGVDHVPQSWIKFTTNRFEFHRNAGAEDIDYPDIATGVWVHHVVVKEGSSLFYYRDGVLGGTRTISDVANVGQPLFFGGQGLENWGGFMSDVRLYAGALEDFQVLELFNDKGGLAADDVLRITNVTRAPDGSVTIGWNGSPGSAYLVYGSTDLANWSELDDGLEATTYTLPAGFPGFDPAVETRIYLRVQESGN